MAHHHSAQKSTRTGVCLEASRTRSSKDSSPASKMAEVRRAHGVHSEQAAEQFELHIPFNLSLAVSSLAPDA